jgi:hypothetical protein
MRGAPSGWLPNPALDLRGGQRVGHSHRRKGSGEGERRIAEGESGMTNACPTSCSWLNMVDIFFGLITCDT